MAIVIKSKFAPHEAQQKILNSVARFRIVIAGRRFGKSVLAINCCIEEAIKNSRMKIWYCSPLYKQTKEIAWNLFGDYLPKEFIFKRNEADLKLVLTNGSEIALKGTDNPDSLVGVGLNFCVMDEFPLMDKDVWYKIVRPMLIDTRGKCLFIGTPRGFNWAYELYQRSKFDSDFENFTFKTIDNKAVSEIPKEVDKAKTEAISEIERITFRQEYEASFENIVGRPRFDLDTLGKLRLEAHEPIGHEGQLAIFSQPEPYSKYAIGVDTSEGLIGGDNSTATIINLTNYEVVAHYIGKIPPDILATHIKLWAEKFNNAEVIVESNNHGLVTLNFLKEIYQEIFKTKHYDKVNNEWTEKMGFQTTPKTKPLLIANLDKALRAGLKVPDSRILDELMTYIVEDDGTTNASEGHHDDSVMSLALSVQAYIESEIRTSDKPQELGDRKSILWWDRMEKHREEAVYG